MIIGAIVLTAAIWAGFGLKYLSDRKDIGVLRAGQVAGKNLKWMIFGTAAVWVILAIVKWAAE